MRTHVFVYTVLFSVHIANACNWAVPATLLPPQLVRGVNSGLDHKGSWIISAMYSGTHSKEGFKYEIVAVDPPSVHVNSIPNNKQDTVIAYKKYDPKNKLDHHLNHQTVFKITVGVACNGKKIASADYNIKLTAGYTFDHYYNNSRTATLTENGWKTNSTLVFFPDVKHYSNVTVSKTLNCQHIHIDSSLKMFTSENNKCGTNGKCKVVVHINLKRTMHCPHKVLDGMSVSYAVSQIMCKEKKLFKD